MWAKIGKLCLQTHIVVAFRYVTFCLLTCTTWKLKVVWEHSINRTTALLLETSICGLELYVRYDQYVMDWNTHHNHFSIQHVVGTYTHSLKTTGHMWMFYVSNDCSTIRDVYFLLLELDLRYWWWVMAANTPHSVFWISHLCVVTFKTWKL